MKERRTYVRNMKERRKYVRFEINQVVEMRMGRESFVNAQGVDLSEAGILCKTDIPVDYSSKIFIMFQIPQKDGERTISCDGVVVRCDKSNSDYLVGIKFVDLKDADFKAISAYSASVAAKKK